MLRPLRISAAFALLAALSPAVTTAADALPGKSPFGAPLEKADGKTTAPAADADYEFMGMVATPKGPLLSIARKNAKKATLWIPVGGSREEITVVSYDARHERAVIQIAGQRRMLAMRKAVIVAGENAAPESQPPAETTPPPEAPPPPADSPPDIVPTAADATGMPAASVPDPKAAPESPPSPGSDEAAAEEARNLVSDLMDIGQQQRQAYEAAARSAGQTTGDSQPAPAPDQSAVEPTPDEKTAPAQEAPPARNNENDSAKPDQTSDTSSGG